MPYLGMHMGYWDIYFGVTALAIARYIILAGLGFGIVWVWGRKYFRRWRTQAKPIASAQIRREVGYSLLTMFIFGATGVLIWWLKAQGWTWMYDDIRTYGWGYFALSVVLLIVLHDAYFYWTHRAMHHPRIFRHVHRVHHLSTSPTPWAAFAFHPLEAVVEAGILPLAVFVLPLHVSAIALFLLYMTVLNVLGHLGHELFPSGFTTGRWSWWHNTATHHDLHHRTFRHNFGLYFNWWDRWMGTNHPAYHQTFEATRQPKETVEG